MYAKKHILIIESQKDLQKILKLSLKMEAGWEVVTVDCEREAAIQLDRIKFDAIILNLVNGDRLPTLEKLKTNPQSAPIPVIAIGLSDRTGESSYLTKLGAAVVIPQMLNPILLSDRIAKKLNWFMNNSQLYNHSQEIGISS